MMEKDYLLRMYGQMARAFARLLFLKNQKDYTLALELSDQLLHETLGVGSGFVNSMSEEMLVQMLSSANVLDVDKALVVANILTAEGDIYQELGNSTESYYRYLRSLNLYLLIADFEQTSHASIPTDLRQAIEDLNKKLSEYVLPAPTSIRLQEFFESTPQTLPKQADTRD